MGIAPYRTTVLVWRSASPTHPGRTIVANTAITRAPPARRATTAAVGLQPASISALANGPDDPNANADPTASIRPSRKSSTVARSFTVMGCTSGV